MCLNITAGREVCSVKDEDKTKEQLIDELAELRRRIADLKASEDERKLIEEELRTSEERFKILFEYAPDAYYLHDLKGYFVDGNKAAEKITGYMRDELIGKNFLKLNLLPPSQIPKAAELLAESTLGQPAGPDEFTLNRKDGSQAIVEIRTFPVKIKNRTLVLGIARDITERKQVEEALRKSEEKYRFIYEESSTMNIIVGIDGTVKDINNSLLRKLGYSKDEVIGKYALEFIVPEQQEEAAVQIENAFKGESTPEIEFDVLAKDGSRHTILFSYGQVLLYEGDQPIGVLFTGIDIAERKRAEEALTAERERLAVTLRSIGDGVITTDTEGKIALINSIAETLTGWTADEAIGRYLDEVFNIINEKTRERYENPVKKALETGKIVRLANHAVLITRDGTERIIADSGAPIRDRDGKTIGVVLVFRDITEKRKMEEELLKVQKLESIGILAGGIAHDFNNILTAILGNISLVSMYVEDGETKDRVMERLAEAERASMRAQNLTQQLLTFSKGGAPVKRTASIRELLRDSTLFALSGSNVRCEFYMPDDLWSVEIDEGQISQVINNLVINADQAMPEGGIIKVRAENITLKTGHSLPLTDGEYVKISVEDQGIGISKEHLQRVFDPYFTTKQKGSGLGLATSYSIIKNHGGYITAESRVGVGSTFHVYLPASPEKIPTDKGKVKEKPVVGRGRILLMDDERYIRNLLDRMLDSIGYEVTLATDGVEAIELYREAKDSGRPYDAVILDLTVPGGMGGKVAIQRLKEIDPEVKAIVSSGYSDDPVLSDFGEYGFSGFIAKPYRIRELSSVLHKVITETDNSSF
mgnify:CR=1 FL=1